MKIEKIQIKKILKNCLKDGLEIIKEKFAEDKKWDWKSTFDHHRDFPVISQSKDNFPCFNLSSYNSSQCFSCSQ